MHVIVQDIGDFNKLNGMFKAACILSHLAKTYWSKYATLHATSIDSHHIFIPFHWFYSEVIKCCLTFLTASVPQQNMMQWQELLFFLYNLPQAYYYLIHRLDILLFLKKWSFFHKLWSVTLNKWKIETFQQLM